MQSVVLPTVLRVAFGEIRRYQTRAATWNASESGTVTEQMRGIIRTREVTQSVLVDLWQRILKAVYWRFALALPGSWVFQRSRDENRRWGQESHILAR